MEITMQQSYDNLRLLLNSRYSCRAYKKQEVSEKDIREIISTASRVPTWCNAQPWEVLVTRGEATEKLSQLLIESTKTQQINPDFNWPTQYVGQYAQRRRQCGYQLYESIGIQKEDKKRRKEQMMLNYKFFGAPHVAIITSESDLGPYGSMDCGGFIAAFTIVAQAKGIATIAQASITGYAQTIRKYFQIPKNRLIQTAISFGYSDDLHPINHFRTEREKSEKVVKIFS
tara:strand:- start:441 stop:1127 length:687 start_codon:yes stop_codon:yes gene_type:complete